MVSSFTTNFGFEEIATGEQSGTWGTTTNFNFDILDRITSYKAVALSDASTATLTVREASPGAGTENLQDGMYRVIKFTGTLSQNCTVTVAPNTTSAYFVFINATTDAGSSGPYTTIISQGSGANYIVANGTSALVYCDGAGGGAVVTAALVESLTTRGDIVVRNASNLTSRLAVGSANRALLSDGTDVAYGQVSLTAGVTGTLPIANGGTNSTSTTYCALGSNVSGTLPVANGGTGATTHTANGVLIGEGTSALTTVAPSTSGNILTSDGTDWTSAAASGGGGLLGAPTIFTSTGTYTENADASRIVVWCVGGGGGGGGGAISAPNYGGGGGGGGGGTSIETLEASAVGSTETVTIGAAGAAGAAANGTGGTGGTSSFGSLCSATGGVGGTAAAGTPQNGGLGGLGAGGDINILGGMGTFSITRASYNAMCGNGGNSWLGGGGRGGDFGSPTYAGSAPTGGFGGGGGGASNGSPGAGEVGGAGTAGIVIVWEYA